MLRGLTFSFPRPWSQGTRHVTWTHILFSQALVPEDATCHVGSVAVFGGMTSWDISKELAVVQVTGNEYSVTLLRNAAEEHRCAYVQRRGAIMVLE